jgi:hypothetical protein
MARGWESKGVEDQQAEALERRSSASKRMLSAPEIAEQSARDALRLSRSRVIQQLETARNPAYRQTLEAALAELDHKLSSQNGQEL